MSTFGKSRAHFLAKINIYPCGPEPTRRDKPAFNGIRWSFIYAEDYEKYAPNNPPISDVWPDFLDENGLAIVSGVPLIGSYTAKMHIIFDNMVEKHFERLKVGTKFYCTEGSMKTAEGVVTKLSV
jgi:hypothetical protein